MPRLISTKRFMRLVEAERKLAISARFEQTKQDVNSARCKELEAAVIDIAKVLDPKVSTVDEALGIAAKLKR